MTQTPEKEDGFTVAILRAKIDTLTIYEISEEELLTIERGSPDSIYLTIAIALLSFALAIFCSLLVTEIKSTVVMIVYVLIVIVGFVIGVILLARLSMCMESAHQQFALLPELHCQLAPETFE